MNAAMNMFVAGDDLVRWELTALQPEGPFRLTMDHSRGSIVEYFHDVRAALSREAELEALLIVAGNHGQSVPGTTWISVSGGVH
jgi:hypothetical protein